MVCEICSYPFINSEATKKALAEFHLVIETKLSQQGYKLPEHLKDLYKEVAAEDAKKNCLTCTCNNYLGYLLIEMRKIEKEKGQSEETEALLAAVFDSLLIMQKVACQQFGVAVILESKEKVSAKPDSALLSSWFIHRLQQITYSKPLNTTNEERQDIQEMRKIGYSIRDIAFLTDRSNSTIVEILKQ